jgi:hypothetical protein
MYSELALFLLVSFLSSFLEAELNDGNRSAGITAFCAMRRFWGWEGYNGLE